MIEARIAKRFVEDVLKQEGELMSNDQRKAIQGFGLINSSNMLNAISVSTTSPDNADGALSQNLLMHQRFMDMKKLSNQPKHKAFPIYNKIVFGHYNSIAYKLMYYCTEDVVNKIKSEMINEL